MKKQISNSKLVIILLFLSVLCLGYFVIYKSVEKINSNKLGLIQSKQELRNYTSNSKASSTLELIDSILENSDRLEKTVLTKGNEIDLINTLEKLASDREVSQQIAMLGENNASSKAQTIKTQKEKLEGSDMEIIDFQLKIGASFDAILNYLEAIESTDLYIKINSIEFTRPLESGEELLIPANGIKATITANTYAK